MFSLLLSCVLLSWLGWSWGHFNVTLKSLLSHLCVCLRGAVDTVALVGPIRWLVVALGVCEAVALFARVRVFTCEGARVVLAPCSCGVVGAVCVATL